MLSHPISITISREPIGVMNEWLRSSPNAKMRFQWLSGLRRIGLVAYELQ